MEFTNVFWKLKITISLFINYGTGIALSVQLIGYHVHNRGTLVQFSIGTGHFRRFRKIAKSVCWLRHVCPSIRMEELGSHWADFHEI
jgi:hypothetical protein